MAKHVSYTQKSLKLLRSKGWVTDIAEKWIMGANIRRDLFGIADILSLIPKGGVLGVQSTSFAQRRKHIIKLERDCRDSLIAWLESGSPFWLISWKKKKRGKSVRYYPVIERWVLNIKGEPYYYEINFSSATAS